MDTNQNNGQNYQINAFVKGMNSDTSLDQVSNEQYLFGRNIRITNNALLTQDINSNNKEGIVTPVPVGQSKKLGISGNLKTILATASIGNIGAIILKKQDDTWDVYKVQLNNDEITPTLLFSSEETTDKKQFSVVINKEQENLIKLYIADGENGIMQLFLQHPTITDLSTYYNDKEIDDLISHKYFPTNKVVITGVIGGQLKTSQVQYTYRLYQKYGTFSKLAPLTNKIQIINNNRNTEEGNAEDTKTSMGLSLQITDSESIFDHIQVYRIQYIKAGQLPEINLIKDQKFNGSVKIDDTGLDSLQQLSLDEFSALDGQDIIPTVIESNQSYLFGANVKDTTVFDLENFESSDFRSRSFRFDNNNQVDININDFDIPLQRKNDQTIGSLIGGEGAISWKLVGIDIPIDSVPTETETKKTISTPQENNGSFYYIGYDIQREECVCIEDDDFQFSDYLGNHDITIDEYKKEYSDIFTSSLLRSLRRDEVYRYGIVFYNKYGQKTQTYFITDVHTPTINQWPNICEKDGIFYSRTIGIEFEIDDQVKEELEENGVIGYEIVRCQKPNAYSRILLQCALSRPVLQWAFGDADHTQKTPYYPMPFISTDICYFYYLGNYFGTFNSDNKNLFQIFSSEINISRSNVLDELKESIKFMPLYRIEDRFDSFNKIGPKDDQGHTLYVYKDSVHLGAFKIEQKKHSFSKAKKQTDTHSIFLYDTKNPSTSGTNLLDIVQIKDVKNPTWESGFTHIESGGSNSQITQGIKSYKQYSTTIEDLTYVNWVATNKYDFPIYKEEAENYNFDGYTFYHETKANQKREYTDSLLSYTDKAIQGWIGPGPVCFIAKTKEPTDDSIFNGRLTKSNEWPGAIISNIFHYSKQFSGKEETDYQYDVYYGFGNYQSLGVKNLIFDGDIYNVPCEFTSMFKAWDFKSIDDYIESTQFINYIPLETKINTFFDYGMNYLNTQNENLQLEPGTITGITVQDRPLHQYNPIYSDNDTSVSVYYAQPLEKTQNIYPHRIVYSQQKTNGENIDNWNIFKPIDFVDADTRYGEITELMTVNDILYFWQNTAFGKLSVNERSLITDENSNTIQLGQGGVLQRTDYISTKYGMRPEDYSAIEAEGGVYWIDILNKAIVAYLQGRVINYGEHTNVQNIINNQISEEIPQIDYDLQNMELLCKCLNGGDQLIFSTKLGCATSLYNRSYDNIISFNNVLYGLEIATLEIRKLNYLTNNQFNELLQPEELSFVVNSSPSQTKVFDNQKIVTLKRDYEFGDRMDNKTLYFETDLNQASGLKEDEIKEAGVYTDREGNICYTIPREEDNIDTTVGRPMSLRLRGKWMKVDIEDQSPQQDFAISHVITKFRQSYS